MTDRNEFIDHVFAELQEIESAIPGGTPTRAARYIDGGNWLIQPGFALACLRRRIRWPRDHPILAGVSVKGLLRSCRSYARAATLLADSQAAVVNVRQRAGGCMIRSFYPFTSHPVTIKASQSGHDRLQREVENRRIVEDLRHLRAPKILHHDLTAQCPFLIEQYVDGRIALRRTDQTLLRQTLLPDLQRHYEAFGVSCKAIKSWFGRDVDEKIESAAEQLSWDPSWRDRQQFMSVVRRLAESDKQFTLSFCHGDLSVAHVAVSEDGKIFLLDWESAGVQPIAFDLVKLARTCRVNRVSFYMDCEKLLSELSLTVRSGDLFSPTEQMFLASLRKLFDWQSYQAQYRIQGKDPKLVLRTTFSNANELLKHL